MERILMEMVSDQAKNATSSFGDMEIKQYGRGILARWSTSDDIMGDQDYFGDMACGPLGDVTNLKYE